MVMIQVIAGRRGLLPIAGRSSCRHKGIATRGQIGSIAGHTPDWTRKELTPCCAKKRQGPLETRLA